MSSEQLQSYLRHRYDPNRRFTVQSVEVERKKQVEISQQIKDKIMPLLNPETRNSSVQAIKSPV
jgi:hypothetical protein